MNIHESKAVLRSFGALVAEGRPALTVAEAVAVEDAVAGKLSSSKLSWRTA